jgi:uncharacterized protein YndB with AHSA1/START domain
MPPIRGSIEIRRSPEDVFNYIADATQRPQWQDAVEKIEVLRSTPEGVGTRVRETRRVQGRSITATWEVTEYEPARRFGFRGVDGPVRPVVSMTLTPLEDATRTQVEIEVGFQTFGIGKLFGVLARRGARQEVPKDGEHLKDRLEGAGAEPPT